MTKFKRQQLTLKVHQVFQLLLEHPGGLSTKDLWSQLQQTPHRGNGNGNGNGANAALLTFEELSFFCVGPIKAGWLVVERNHWTVSTEGKKAFASCSSPQELIAEAGKRSTQGWLATQFPGAYSAAGKAKDQITSEVRTIRRVGASRLLKETFGKSVPWQEVLPVQSPRTIEVPLNDENLIDHVQAVGANYREGSHAIYLSPSSLKSTALSSLAADYPADAGIKIMKNPGSLDESSYLMGRAKG